MLLVTALYDIDGGSLGFRSYLGLLRQWLSFGVPSWVFCDPHRRPEVAACVPAGADVVVMGIPLHEFRTYSAIMAARPELPRTDNPAKDTLAYLALMNTKVEFALRAAMMRPSVPVVAFLDAGVTRLFRTPELARRRLQALHHHTLEGCLFPGIHGRQQPGTPPLTEVVNWRFCGAFFAAQRDRLVELERSCNELLHELLARGRISWEVNVWAMAELRGMSLGWYPADHDDRLLAWPGAPCTT